MGVSVSKLLGNAVVRNSVKRKYREIFRLNRHLLKDGVFLVFKAKQECASASYQEIETDLIDILKKARLYNE